MQLYMDRFFQLLEDQNMNLYSFSKISQIPYSTLRRYKEDSIPNMETMTRISESLNKPISYFYEAEQVYSDSDYESKVLNIAREIPVIYRNEFLKRVSLELDIYKDRDSQSFN